MSDGYWCYSRLFKYNNKTIKPEEVLELGYLYEHGIAVGKNKKTALDLYRYAALEKDDPMAQYHLGLMYETGNDIVRNEKGNLIGDNGRIINSKEQQDIAKGWYVLAELGGHENAKQKIQGGRRTKKLKRSACKTARKHKCSPLEFATIKRGCSRASVTSVLNRFPWRNSRPSRTSVKSK
jgi:hypothetical protein